VICKETQKDLFLDAPVWWEGLTGKRRLFVEYYCGDRTCFLNATAAYIKAFGNNGEKRLTDSSIQSNAPRMLRDPKIKEAVNKLLRARQNDEDRINEFKILELLQTLAFYNPKDIIGQYGGLKKPLEELGGLAVCVTGIEPGRHGARVKLFDREKALALLGRYLDIIRPAEGAAVINPVVYISGKDGPETGSPEPPEAEDAQYELVNAGTGA